MSMSRLETLKRKLNELEAAIIETEKRLPAHSLKPPVMQDLLELEDQRDRLLQEIAELATGDAKESKRNSGSGAN